MQSDPLADLLKLADACGMSLTDLSIRSGIERTILSKIRNGHRPARVSEVAAIARALNARLAIVPDGFHVVPKDAAAA